MPAVMDDRPALSRGSTTRTVVYTTLYDLIAAMHDAIAPGEEACVAPLVADLLHAGRARWLREVDVETLEAEPPRCVSP